MTPQALALRGQAGSLSALIRAGGQPLMMLPVRWQGSGEVLASYQPRAGGLGDIRLSLPPRTPPGKYDATIILPEGETPLVLEVEPRPRVSFHPRAVSVTGRAATVTVTALNEGNASVDIPKSAEVALYAVEEDFFERVLRERKDGEHVIDRIFDGLAGTFAGTMRISVESGAGPFAADEARELTLALAAPDEFAPETTYEGNWSLDGGSLAIAVRTAKEEQTS